MTAALADLSTAVLLDPEVSAAQAIAAGALPGKSAFVVALESTGYSGEPTARRSQILPGWSVEKARRMGASMVKLLVYYHPDSPTAREVEAFVRQVADECTRYDLGIMLEPLSYSLDAAKKLSSAEKRTVVIETARRLVGPGIDVLKSEFPLDPAEDSDESTWFEACSELSAASPRSMDRPLRGSEFQSLSPPGRDRLPGGSFRCGGGAGSLAGSDRHGPGVAARIPAHHRARPSFPPLCAVHGAWQTHRRFLYRRGVVRLV